MRLTPNMVLRGVLKFLAVAVAAGVVGAGLGIALAELSGGDDTSTPVAPSTTSTERTTTQRTTARTTTSTQRTETASPSAAAQTTSTSARTTPTTTTPARVSRTTRVQILSAVLFPARTARGRARQRARVVVRVRLTSRSVETLPARAPMLLVEPGRVRVDPRAADVAGPLLRPLAPAKSATGELRFETIGAVTQQLTNQRSARLSIAGRTVSVSIGVSSTPAPAG